MKRRNIERSYKMDISDFCYSILNPNSRFVFQKLPTKCKISDLSKKLE